MRLAIILAGFTRRMKEGFHRIMKVAASPLDGHGLRFLT
jgi:hypothetical protein